MSRAKVLLGLIAILFAGLATAGYASASPSEGFHEVNGDVFDD
jgi:hypothetical protein